MKTLLVVALASLSFIAQASAAKAPSREYKEYMHLDGYEAHGKATVYSSHFHNKKTASGLKYLRSGYTAASMKLPMLSVLKVTNKNNNKSIFVLVNDRGSFKKALVDLSRSAASAIGITSIGNVTIEFDLQKTLEVLADKSKIKQFGL